ncbi:MAG: class I SAM-dependent methyltransferase [Planctomycetaceae bacterium]
MSNDQSGNSFVGWLASMPTVFDGLRWILEGGYRGHKSVLKGELRDTLSASTQNRVLDLGCGTGIHAPHFSPGRYQGVDVSASYIQAARRKFAGYQFDLADARTLKFEDGSFQTVLISGVLHHLNDEDATAVLSEAARMLSNGGVAVIWEDIPCRSAWNIVGSLIHRLDQGKWIRTPSRYRELLAPWFHLESERSFRSGVMDYVVFRAVLQKHGGKTY